MLRALLVLMVAALGACAAPAEDLFATGQGALSKSIYLVNHGGHAGIVVRRADIPDGVWPQHNDFPKATYLEVGWGDRRYYQMVDPHLGIALKAALWPTSSVLHIVGFSDPVPVYFPNNDVIEIVLSHAAFERLCGYIADSYDKDEDGVAAQLGPGRYGDSRFYLSRETYHIFKTCNVWVAKGLRAAGCPITPAFAITADSLMSRARRSCLPVEHKW